MKFPTATRTLLIILCTAIFSCKTVLKSGYEVEKEKMAIDIRNHQLSYRYEPGLIDKESAHIKLDLFDKLFLGKMESNIREKGLMVNTTGEIQTLKLEDCLVDFTYLPPVPKIQGTDTLWIYPVQAALLCTETSDSMRVFFARAVITPQMEVKPVQDTISSLENREWNSSGNFLYRQKPIESVEINRLATDLAKQASIKADSASALFYTRTFPEKATKMHEVKEPTAFGTAMAQVGIVALLLFISIFF